MPMFVSLAPNLAKTSPLFLSAAIGALFPHRVCLDLERDLIVGRHTFFFNEYRGDDKEDQQDENHIDERGYVDIRNFIGVVELLLVSHTPTYLSVFSRASCSVFSRKGEFDRQELRPIYIRQSP